jgi:hypothetical protein
VLCYTKTSIGYLMCAKAQRSVAGLEAPAAAGRDDPTVQRLEDQIAWYDGKSGENQRRFKLLKGVQLIAAATIPVAATFGADPTVAATLGATIVVVEGVQQLNQYQQNWTLYRSNAEALKHEKFLFLARAGPYAHSEDGRALLADRIEGLISQEHAKWVSARQEKEEGNHG